MDIQFGNLYSLHLLWVVAAVVGVMLLAMAARRRALAKFATANLIGRLAPGGSRVRQLLKAALATAALAAMVLALLDIRWGKVWRETPQKGIEVMFVLDVSRSMLAEDAAPNRLERAKQQISDMVDAMAGDRVGLVAFAGGARRLAPLTSHYHDFKQTLREAGPQDVDRGGSRLGDALQLAADGFLDQTGDHKAIVVLTDGEDQESEPVKTAEKLYADQGIRIFTVGLGDADQGARVPEQTSGRERAYVEYQGQQVWSKMNGATLKQVAFAADGAYIPAGVKQVDMAQVYRRYVSQVEQRDFETARIHSYVPRYPWFVGMALLLLAMDTLLPATSRQKTASRAAQSVSIPAVENSKAHGKRPAITAAALAVLFFTPALSAAEPADLVRQANQALQAGQIEQALADYQKAAELAPDRPELLYNQAVAQYRTGRYDQARQLLAQTAAVADQTLEAKARYNLGNCDYAEAVSLAQQDKPAAIKHLQSAMSHYRAALAGNPADTDARANLQLAQMLIDQLQQEEEQDQQKQEQQKQDQEKQDQQDQNKEQNKEQDQESQDDQQQQNEESSSDQGEDGKPEQNEESPNKDSESSANEESEEPSPGDQPESSDEKETEKKEDQPANPSDNSQGEEEPTQEDQQPQSGESQENAEPAENQPHPGDVQPSGAPASSESGEEARLAESRPMTKEEAQKMLQAVRDRELMRHLQQQRQSQRRRLPVDRDW